MAQTREQLNSSEKIGISKIRVAIVHDFLTDMGGAEKVTQSLCEIFPSAPIYTLLYDAKLDRFFPQKRIIVSYLQKWRQNCICRLNYYCRLWPKPLKALTSRAMTW